MDGGKRKITEIATAPINHYEVLGLPSIPIQVATKLTPTEISKAYRLKALELHPDKRPQDPNANSKFQNLKSSYEILIDEKLRKIFDNDLILHHMRREEEEEAKVEVEVEAMVVTKRRRKMMMKEERKHEEETNGEALEAWEILMMQRGFFRTRNWSIFREPNVVQPQEEKKRNWTSRLCVGLNKERVLKVTWEESLDCDYCEESLRHLFAEFGQVDDVFLRPFSSRRMKTRTALVVMETKDAAVSAVMGRVLGWISNPLLVLPIDKAG